MRNIVLWKDKGCEKLQRRVMTLSLDETPEGNPKVLGLYGFLVGSHSQRSQLWFRTSALQCCEVKLANVVEFTRLDLRIDVFYMMWPLAENPPDGSTLLR